MPRSSCWPSRSSGAVAPWRDRGLSPPAAALDDCRAVLGHCPAVDTDGAERGTLPGTDIAAGVSWALHSVSLVVRLPISTSVSMPAR